MWVEIIPNLCTNADNEDTNVKESALQTLGYICEELENGVLDQENTNLVISALIEACGKNTENAEVMKISMQAILHSLIFAQSIFYEGKGSIITERVLS
jgi:importin subunit beta-1